MNNQKRKGRSITDNEVELILDDICENLKDDTHDLMAEEYICRNRPKNVATEGNKHARSVLSARWTSLFGKLGVVSGKAVLSQTSTWTQHNYGVSLNAFALAKTMVPDEFDPNLWRL
jgi:hypothetical protein